MLNLIVAGFIFMMVIFIHELGHFLVAKAVGIKVNEFSIGMGPSIINKCKGETEYNLRLFPIGGYVSMEGEDEDSDDNRSFNNASVWQRIAVIIMGPVMNFILAFFIFIIISLGLGSPSRTIENVIEGSPAAEIDLIKGDMLVNIDGNLINNWEDVSKYIQESEGQTIELTIERNNELETRNITPIKEEGRLVIGIVPTMEKNFIKSIRFGYDQTKNNLAMMFNFIRMALKGQVGLNKVSGPVGIFTTIGRAADTGIYQVLVLLAIISINLGFFNLLPIPALDGGRIFFLLIELIVGKPIEEKYEGMIHLLGFILMISLLVVVTYKDIFTLIRGD